MIGLSYLKIFKIMNKVLDGPKVLINGVIMKKTHQNKRIKWKTK